MSVAIPKKGISSNNNISGCSKSNALGKNSSLYIDIKTTRGTAINTSPKSADKDTPKIMNNPGINPNLPIKIPLRTSTKLLYDLKKKNPPKPTNNDKNKNKNP